MKIYITKYATTKGILTAEGREVGNGMAKVSSTSYFHEGEWFRTFDEAKIDALKRRESKIRSAKKALVKLENLTFDESQVKDY